MISSRSSFQRKLESRFFKAFWTPAFAGVTKLQTNSEVPYVGDVSRAVTLGQYLARRFGGRQVIGDRIKLGGVELVVREIVDGAITRVGLKLHD